MRILMLCEGDPEQPLAFSGIGKNIVDHLRLDGHEIRTADCDLSGVDRYVVAGLTWSTSRRRWVSRYHTARVAFHRRSRRAASHIAELGASDVVLQIGATFAPHRIGGRPYYLYCDANFRMAERAATSWAAALTPDEVGAVVAREAAVYAGASAIFTLSERARRSFIEDFAVPPERVVTVHAGSNLSDEAIRRGRAARRDDTEGPVVLFVGREFERKGGDIVLRAFARLREEIPSARLRIVGPRDLRLDLPGVEVLGLLRRDHPDELEQLIDAYATADIFCFPTRFEPFGIVAVEAMRFGLPVVASDVWALPEIVADGETGFLVPPDDADAVADRLLTLGRDPALARRMGAAGMARAEERFTWAAVTRRMTRVMERGQAGVMV